MCYNVAYNNKQMKDLYKKFGIKKESAKPGDLISASRKPLMKKYKKVVKESKESEKKEGKKHEAKESKSMEKEEHKMMKNKKPKLGSGKRFAQLTSKLSAKGAKGAKNPKALAAWIGRKKYGAKKFGKLSAMGKK